MSYTNRQQDERNAQAIADGERQYAADVLGDETPCRHAHTERLTGQATPGTFAPGRRPNSGIVELCLDCGRRFEA